MPSVRRLTAILAADVAGYSRLMGADEEGTHERLKAHFRELIDPKIAEHRGRTVKNTGDGLLAEFPSVVDAVRCAAEIQRGMLDREPEVPDERRIRFRIGVNLGDVIAEENDIFGDGVNIAARLEALADPGGICVSRVVRDQVRDKLDYTFEDLGEQQVKNIARPVRVYRVRDAGSIGSSSPPAPAPPVLPLPDKPSIAVLPFQNISGDPEQEYFADGMVEEIITALSRIRWLFVIARNSSFTYKGRAVDVKQVGRELGVRYVLEGSVRKAGTQVRITGQLIDTTTGAHIWADRFDGALDDIFDLQDLVASNVAGAIEPKLRQSEIERATRKPTDSLAAYDLHLRALAHLWKWTPEGWREAIDLSRQALVVDPSYAPAAGLFAWCRVLEGARRAVSAQEGKEGLRLARLAIEKGNEDPDALWMGGWGILILAGDRAAGLSAMERSLALNPNSALAWCFFGWAQSYDNRSAQAIQAVQQAMRLSPRDPQPWVFYGGLAVAHFAAGRCEEAVEWADRALQAQPRMTSVVGIKAAACAQLGRIEEGREYLRRLCALLRPEWPTIAATRQGWGKFVSPEFLATWLEGLRKAGMPEE
jgi:TolB-like protein/class 3 adenylate cyclase